MKLKNTRIFLLALLLAGMVTVMMVSAADEKTVLVSNDREVQAIFDSAASLESMPTSSDPQIEMHLLENYVSPADRAIRTMKSNHYSVARITNLLKKNGYGWDPKTGASWKGRAPTPEEQKTIDQIRGPGYSPFPVLSQSGQPSGMIAPSSVNAKGSTMNLWDENTYFGLNIYMSPGPMVVSTTGTAQHVVTCHLGKKKPSGVDDWTEAGVVRMLNTPELRYFTFDSDEGQWQFHGTASTTSLKNYQIYVTGTLEPAGYLYYTWINGRWVKSGHLYYRQTKFNCANEIWANNNNPFSRDGGSSYFQNGYLFKSTGYQWWGDYPGSNTYFRPDNPPFENHYMMGSAYTFITWV